MVLDYVALEANELARYRLQCAVDCPSEALKAKTSECYDCPRRLLRQRLQSAVNARYRLQSAVTAHRRLLRQRPYENEHVTVSAGILAGGGEVSHVTVFAGIGGGRCHM